MATPDELLSRFDHYSAPTLSHLLALLTPTPPSFLDQGTGLIVVDTVSVPFATAFPRALEEQNSGPPHPSGQHGGPPYAARRNDALYWASTRRWALMGDLAARLAQLAATANVAVLLLSQTGTKVRTEVGTLLRPALASKAWLEGVASRLVVFRDYGRGGEKRAVRYVGVIKHRGQLHQGLERVWPFVIDKVRCTSKQVRAVDLLWSCRADCSRSPPRKYRRLCRPSRRCHRRRRGSAMRSLTVSRRTATRGDRTASSHGSRMIRSVCGTKDLRKIRVMLEATMASYPARDLFDTKDCILGGSDVSWPSILDTTLHHGAPAQMLRHASFDVFLRELQYRGYGNRKGIGSSSTKIQYCFGYMEPQRNPRLGRGTNAPAHPLRLALAACTRIRSSPVPRHP